MKQVSLAPPIVSALDTSSEAFDQNRIDMLEQLGVIDELLDQAELGGGEAAMDRMRSRGKLPVRERIAHVLDPDSPFLEISALAGYGSDYAVGGGMIVGILLLDVGVQGMQVTNQSVIYGVAPLARSRITAAYMACYFVGGAAGSAVAAQLYGSHGWAGICLLGGGIGMLTVVGFVLNLWYSPREATSVSG